MVGVLRYTTDVLVREDQGQTGEELESAKKEREAVNIIEFDFAVNLHLEAGEDGFTRESNLQQCASVVKIHERVDKPVQEDKNPRPFELGVIQKTHIHRRSLREPTRIISMNHDGQLKDAHVPCGEDNAAKIPTFLSQSRTRYPQTPRISTRKTGKPRC